MTLLSYRRHRFPPEIIQHAIWLYLRFILSYCDVEELLAERGVEISYETVRALGAEVRADLARQRTQAGWCKGWSIAIWFGRAELLIARAAPST
jgi:transposase-like protein